MDDIWSVESQEKYGRTLTKIVYGEMPVGFNATTPQILFPGDDLYVSFYREEYGMPRLLGGGTRQFTVSK